MIIRITKHDGTFIKDVPSTPENLSETIKNCKLKYSPQDYHAVLITY